MARITRKELKSDKFAQEVELSVTFFEEHQKEVIRYGGIGVAVAVLILGFVTYNSHQHAARQEELAAAIRVQETPVANVAQPGTPTFPTEQAKEDAAMRAFGDLVAKHSGSDEAMVAEYYIGSIHADQGKMSEAEKNFKDVADHGDKNYSSLGKNALAEIYFSDGRNDQGEKILRDLIQNPTIFVSADQASIELARRLMGKNNAEARKLLEPIKDNKTAEAPIAQQLYSQIPPK